MESIEIYTQALVDSVKDINFDLHILFMKDNYEQLAGVASCIIEPLIKDEDAEDAYTFYVENDTENWVSWIGQTLGADWKQIARYVADYGY
jgi:hypothetical protein